MALGLPLPCSLGSWKAGCSSDAELSLSSSEECKRDTAGRKGVKGRLLVGHEEVPHGFRLRTGDPGDTADSAGNLGRSSSPARITGKKPGGLLKYHTLDWAKQGRKDCVHLWVF